MADYGQRPVDEQRPDHAQGPDYGQRPGIVEWSLILILIAILATAALLLLGDRVDRVIPGFSSWLGSKF